MYKSCCFIILLLTVIFVQTARAGQIKAYVSAFNVVGAENRDEMKETMQDLLASRLNSEAIIVVDSAAEADVVLSSRYSVAGGVFSIDCVARNRAGSVVARSYEEGENQAQLIPSVGKLVPKLQAMIIKAFAQPAAGPQKSPAETSSELKNTPLAADIISEKQSVKNTGSGWLSQRLVGTYTGIAPGRKLENGECELFIVSRNTLKLYRQGNDLKLIAEASFKAEDKILGIDSADLDGDGVPEIYLTIFNGDTLVSQVWTSSGTALKKIAGNLPYYFRSIALNGKDRKLYAQQISIRSDFYGDLYELAKTGRGLELKNPLKLPRFANIYNFNQFTDSKGNHFDVVLNEEGHILVYDAGGEEVWRSKEKFGGSETFFKREDMTDVRYSSEPYRWIYLQQRMVVTSDGEIIIPENSGSSNIGIKRSYSSSAIYALGWNGSSLEKKWHTMESENYIADYYFDAQQQELVTLEVVKHGGMFDRGASIVSVKKVRAKDR